MTIRPANFRINRDSHLAKGLVFAALGQSPGLSSMRDSSVFGNHGTLNNMDPATDWVVDTTLGRRALDFDGSNDYVTFGDRLQFELGADDFTIGMWVKLTTTAGDRRLFDVNAVSAGYSSLVVYQSVGNLNLYASNNATSWPVSNQRIATSPSAGAWYRIAIRRAAGEWTTYSNATLGSSFSYATALYNGTNGLTLGRFDPTAIQYYSGQLADITIHNRALSDIELSEMRDPTNTMLSGMIEATVSRSWHVVKVPIQSVDVATLNGAGSFGQVGVASQSVVHADQAIGVGEPQSSSVQNGHAVRASVQGAVGAFQSASVREEHRVIASSANGAGQFVATEITAPTINTVTPSALVGVGSLASASAVSQSTIQPSTVNAAGQFGTALLQNAVQMAVNAAQGAGALYDVAIKGTTTATATPLVGCGALGDLRALSAHDVPISLFVGSGAFGDCDVVSGGGGFLFYVLA